MLLVENSKTLFSNILITSSSYIKKLNPLYDIYIDNAFSNKDYYECINAFFDILDYKENILKAATLNKILYSNKDILKDSVFVEVFEVFI